jgi:hypothetical protein
MTNTGTGHEPPRKPRKRAPRYYPEHVMELFRTLWKEEAKKGEFNRLNTLPEIENILRSKVAHDTIYAEEARHILDLLDPHGDFPFEQVELFPPYDGVVPLGNNMRIARGRMNLDQYDRFIGLHDKNRDRVLAASKKLHEWGDPRRALMLERPGSLIQDVMTEDGIVLPPKLH